MSYVVLQFCNCMVLYHSQMRHHVISLVSFDMIIIVSEDIKIRLMHMMVDSRIFNQFHTNFQNFINK